MNFVRYKGTNLLNTLWSTIWFKSAFFQLLYSADYDACRYFSNCICTIIIH